MASRPRRLCRSFLCSFMCSVSWRIRAVRTATCTSAEPVSFLLVAYFWMTSAFWAFGIDIGFSLFLQVKDFDRVQLGTVLFHQGKGAVVAKGQHQVGHVVHAGGRQA